MNRQSTIRTALRGASAISPTLAGRMAFPIFMNVRPRLSIRPSDRATHDDARRSTIVVRGRRVAVYEWGSGTDVVLLVHGWRGRASQFATLVRELRAGGFRVVAFDAPANGDSEGRSTYIVDYIDAIRQLERRHGHLHTIIGHSFGTLAAARAVTDGLNVRRFVSIAGAAEASALFPQFAAMVGLDERATDALRDRFQRRLFPGQPNVFTDYSAVANPLPDELKTLIIHDHDDREVPVEQSHRLAAAHPHAWVVLTEGFGHSKVLAADATLDAILEHLAESAAEHPLPEAHEDARLAG